MLNAVRKMWHKTVCRMSRAVASRGLKKQVRCKIMSEGHTIISQSIVEVPGPQLKQDHTSEHDAEQGFRLIEKAERRDVMDVLLYYV